MRLDLADLRLFLCIVDAGSITAGAQRANLALASASERLRNMEDALGLRLLQRRARGVVTTEPGEALARHARVMLRQQQALGREMHDFASGAKGTVELYANTAAVTDFLPGRLGPWLAARPELRVEIKERTSTDIIQAVASGLVEAGVVSNAVQAEGVQVIPVAQDHLVLILAPGHPLAQGRQIAFAQTLNHAFVGMAEGSALQDHINQHARAAGKPLDLRIRMNSFEGLCEMVGHGVGIGVLPLGIAKRHQRRHGFRILALTDAWARRTLCVCFTSSGALSAPMRSLLAHLGAVPHDS